MASLIGHEQTSDLILISSDGVRMPAHLCILRQRAPVFFNRHVAPVFEADNNRSRRHGKAIEVVIDDVDASGLTFFIKSVYTDEEIVGLEQVNEARENTESPGPSMDETNFEIDDEYEQPPPSSNRSRNSDKDVTPRGNGPANSDAGGSPQKRMSRDKDSGFHQNLMEKDRDDSGMLMTSFRELATDSPMCTSNYSERSQYEIVEEEDENDPEILSFGSHGKFLRLEDSGITSGSIGSTSRTHSPIKRKSSSTKIFPMFIGFTGNESEMSQSMPEPSQSPYSSSLTLSAGSIRGRAMLARRLSSVSSLTSLMSIDLTPTSETMAPINDKLPCSKLASDLLEMYHNSVDTDTVIVTDDGELHGHKCILWATCPGLRKALKQSNKIEIRGFSRKSIDFLLCFLYGGLTGLPDDVEVWEIVTLANHLGIEELAQVAALHLKAHKCHFFHRPCATCVSAIFDALPQFKSIKCLQHLYTEALQWQARHFSRIWKGRVFLHLNEEWQKQCRDSLVADVSEESIIDTLLGCEKLQASLPRIKASQLADTVQGLVSDVVEYCTDFLISSFDLVVGSRTFKTHGRGLALNLALLEDIFPSLVHSLSAETAIRTFLTLRDLFIEISQEMEKPSPRRRSSEFLQVPLNDYSQRFIHLVRRLFELTDKHLLHYAYSVVKSDAYELLSKDEQQRIEEAGIFVEMRMPKAPPPRLSSFNRTYKRSSSVGVNVGNAGKHDRTMSLERSRPIISQVVEASEKEELAREKSFIDAHRRANSMREKPDNHSTRRHPSEHKRHQQQPQQHDDRQSTVIQHQQHQKRQVSPQASGHTKIPVPASAAVSSKLKESASPSPSALRKPRQSSEEKVRKGPPPVKKMTKVVPSNPEQFLSERQTTQTIMTVQQHKDLGVDPKELGVPTIVDSPKKSKPKSVVRPMPKDPPLASTTPTVAIMPQKPEPVIPVSLLKPRPHSTTSTTKLATPQKPRSGLTRPTASSAARTTAIVERAKRSATVESKIPKVRA